MYDEPIGYKLVYTTNATCKNCAIFYIFLAISYHLLHLWYLFLISFYLMLVKGTPLISNENLEHHSCKRDQTC